ncbi:MAG TPA: VC0807 family protein [Trebonia sp.]|jgi:hypothetical protein|nr:VC0807 family protein [Trebonia sp.]
MDASSMDASSTGTTSAGTTSAGTAGVEAAGRDTGPACEPAAVRGGWLRSVATIVIVDIAMPLALYSGLRSAGVSAVTALVLSGVFPALSVLAGLVRHRRLEVVGALVLAGIVLGAVLGLVLHSPRLVLVEGSVPTALFGIACLGSLCSGMPRARPLMYGFALEFIGPDSARGREMSDLWRHDGYRRVWRVITAAWGAAFLFEAALRIVVIYSTSTGTALAISKVTPWVFAGVMSAWTFAYGTYRKRKGERAAAPSAPAPSTPAPS